MAGIFGPKNDVGGRGRDDGVEAILEGACLVRDLQRGLGQNHQASPKAEKSLGVLRLFPAGHHGNNGSGDAPADGPGGGLI